MVCETLSERDLYPFNVPTIEEIERVGVYGIHLGDYLFWDEERQTEFIRQEYGWKETEMEGAYKGYKSAECIMAGVHDFTCYLKRGYGRSTFQACLDVRNGLMTREEGFKVAREIDSERPGALDYYLKITNLTEAQFFETIKQLKHLKLIDIDIPIHPKARQNREVTVPFFEQLIAKHRNRQDPREEG
jgi:hypothetical protein